MIAAALLLAQVAPTAASSLAVSALFQAACVRGELRIDKTRAQFVTRKELPPVVRDLIHGGWFAASKGKVESLKIIKITDPASTYLVITNYQTKRPDQRNPSGSCTVVSQSIGVEDGQALLLKVNPNARLGESEWDGPSIRQWRQYNLDDGYSLTLKSVQPNWVVLETTSFPAAKIR